jgi:hypothetical protein
MQPGAKGRNHSLYDRSGCPKSKSVAAPASDFGSGNFWFAEFGADRRTAQYHEASRPSLNR